MNETDNTKPSFFKRLFIFGTTPKVALNCLGMMLASLLIVWLIMGGLLKCYTQHNRTFEVPDFMSMNIEDVKEEASNSRFKFEYTASRQNIKIPPGVIISQNPKAGSRAKNGRTIYITYNSLEKNSSEAPKGLYGLNFTSVEGILKNENFNVKIKKKVIDPDAPGTIQEVWYKDELIESKKGYKSGIKIEEGETIELVVAEDYNGGSTQIPNLVCLTYAEALFTLRNGHNLMLGSVAMDATVTDSTSAYVIGQYPFYEPGQFTNIGSQIDLRLSQRKPAECDGGEDIGGSSNDVGDFTPGDGDESGFTGNDNEAPVIEDDVEDDLDF